MVTLSLCLTFLFLNSLVTLFLRGSGESDEDAAEELGQSGSSNQQKQQTVVSFKQSKVKPYTA